MAIEAALQSRELTSLLSLSEDEVKSEQFAEAYAELQDLAWQKACEGRIEETTVLKQMMQAQGRDLFRHETVQQSILHEAVFKASCEVLAQLLTSSDPNARNSAGQTPLMVLLSHPTNEQLVKAQLFISAPLACDLRLRTTCHYVLRSALSGSSKLQLLSALKAQHPVPFCQCLLTVDADNQTVFSIAGQAFPELPSYSAWLDFLSEVFAAPLQEVAQYPHYLLVQGTLHQQRYSEELFQQVCRAVEPPTLDALMKKRYGDWLKYADELLHEYPLSVVEVLAKTNREETLVFLLKLGYNSNFMSGKEPVWLVLAKTAVSEQCWKLVQAPCLYYQVQSKGFICLQQYSGEDCRSWLESLHSSPCSIAPALRCCLQTLKANSPDYTRAYLESLQIQTQYTPLYARLQHLESILPPELDSENPAYCGALVILLDYAVHNGEEALFFELIAKPRAQEVVKRPQLLYRKSGFTAVLHLTSHASGFNENVNQDFIANSFLYLALRSSWCRANIVKELIRLGCPLLNTALAPDQHDFHPFFTLLRRSINSSPYYISWGTRRKQRFSEEEAATLRELGTVMVAKQDPVFDREVAIGVDLSLDYTQHSQKTSHRNLDYLTWSRTYPDVLRVLLPTQRLFGTIYSFRQDQVGFWTKKTLYLLYHQTLHGLADELQQTTTQLRGFLQTPQVPLRVADIRAEDAVSVTGLATGEMLEGGKFRLKGSKAEVLQHAEALRTLFLTTCFLRLKSTPPLPWLETALRLVSCAPEMFLKGSERQPLAALKAFFHALRAFQRHSCTTLLHYLAKSQELVPDLAAALQGSARFYAHCLNSKGRSPLTMAARAANLEAVELFLQAGIPLSPGSLYLALQGPMHCLTQPLSAEEELKRLQVFQRLFSMLSLSEKEALCSHQSLPEEQVKGCEESFGYPLILACARYSEAGIKQLLALGLSPCLVHSQKLPKKTRQGGRITQSTQLVATCALKEALKRKDRSIALLIYHDIMSKHPLAFSEQRSLYGECAVLAQRLDLQEVAEGIRKA